MKITYDKEADAMYIRLLEGEYECRVVRLTDDIALDFAAGEKLVSACISSTTLARWEGDEMPASVAELNRQAAARTAREQAWSDERSFLERIVDLFRK